MLHLLWWWRHHAALGLLKNWRLALHLLWLHAPDWRWRTHGELWRHLGLDCTESCELLLSA